MIKRRNRSLGGSQDPTTVVAQLMMMIEVWTLCTALSWDVSSNIIFYLVLD
jgi:hypothetical protein